ncbi:MAG: hypothetical protein ACFCUJ_07010 [Thiotrichales bacterium]
MTTPINRRRFMLGLIGFAASPGVFAVAAPHATPSQSRGPFYPVTFPLDDDNDLTRVEGQGGNAEGEVTDLDGRVLDLDGRPIRAARIEIWQCDARGFYHHPQDRGGQADPRFQGFGHTVTDDAGRYRFRTIRPVQYPGRTPHIHFAVYPSGEQPFVTQMYVQGESANAGDFLFRRIPSERRTLVEARFEPAGEGGGSSWRAAFDIVLGAVT